MHRGHGDSRGEYALRIVGGVLAVPEVRLREVATQSIGVENDLGKHPVMPLSGKACGEFLLGTHLMVSRISDGDESGIPIPLMRIQVVKY